MSKQKQLAVSLATGGQIAMTPLRSVLNLKILAQFNINIGNTLGRGVIAICSPVAGLTANCFCFDIETQVTKFYALRILH